MNVKNKSMDLMEKMILSFFVILVVIIFVLFLMHITGNRNMSASEKFRQLSPEQQIIMKSKIEAYSIHGYKMIVAAYIGLSAFVFPIVYFIRRKK